MKSFSVNFWFLKCHLIWIYNTCKIKFFYIFLCVIYLDNIFLKLRINFNYSRGFHYIIYFQNLIVNNELRNTRESTHMYTLSMIMCVYDVHTKYVLTLLILFVSDTGCLQHTENYLIHLKLIYILTFCNLNTNFRLLWISITDYYRLSCKLLPHINSKIYIYGTGN